jgi:DNA-binding Xre family transcriptional regulator
MREQNSSKIFCIALDKMLEHLKSKNINADKIGVPRATISNLRNGKHSKTISNLEKILLDDIVSDEALDFFIEEFKKLLKNHRSADLEDFILGGSQGRKT